MADPGEDGIDPAMAAMMGFQSFGGPQKAKRRKIEDHASTVPATAANETPIATRAGTSTQGDQVNNTTTNQTASRATPTSNQRKQPALTGLAAFLQHGQNLPDPPADAVQESSTATHKAATTAAPGMSPELTAYRWGVPNTNGDMIYFLPSFIEDPWRHDS